MSLRQLERELVGEKHWTLRGEVTAAQRPVNSILDENALEFRTGGRAQRNDKVVVDEKSGEVKERDVDALVEMIVKTRVIERLWDNVKPRADSSKAAETRTLDELMEGVSTTKPTKSLAEEYTGMVVTETGAAINVEEYEKRAQELWTKLSAKLDQYCMS